MENKEDIKYGKTLRELLLDCDFNKIAEYVKDDKQFHDHVEAFCEAYDILLNMIIRNIPKCIIFAIEKIIVK